MALQSTLVVAAALVVELVVAADVVGVLEVVGVGVAAFTVEVVALTVDVLDLVVAGAFAAAPCARAPFWQLYDFGS